MNSIDGKRKRGMITNDDLIEFENYELKSLLELLESKDTYIRTSAVRLIAKKYYSANEQCISDLFIEKLSLEKALYTRIEIQNCLSNGGVITIKQLCKRINTIPNKQHISLPEKITKKKTYPIARDLHIRIISKMGCEALAELKEVISKENENIIKEALDGVGYILYHNRCDFDYQYFIDLFNKYIDNEVIIWKLIRAMSGTNSQELIDFLLNYQTKNLIHKQEIKRTIGFIVNNQIKSSHY